MKKENFLKYKILLSVKELDRTNNILQLEQIIAMQVLDYHENYSMFFSKSFNYLKENGFINTGINNIGKDTVSSLTEKGENILNFSNWEDYEENIRNKKLMEKESQELDIELKKTSLKNQKFLPYTSILGLVFGLGSMIWTIMDKYKLIFVNISIYFLILILIAFVFILLYNKNTKH